MVIKNSNIPNLKGSIYLFGCVLESSLQQVTYCKMDLTI